MIWLDVDLYAMCLEWMGIFVLSSSHKSSLVASHFQLPPPCMWFDMYIPFPIRSYTSWWFFSYISSLMYVISPRRSLLALFSHHSYLQIHVYASSAVTFWLNISFPAQILCWSFCSCCFLLAVGSSKPQSDLLQCCLFLPFPDPQPLLPSSISLFLRQVYYYFSMVFWRVIQIWHVHLIVWWINLVWIAFCDLLSKCYN